MPPGFDLAAFGKDYAFFLTALGGLLGMSVRWVFARFAALETRLVQERERHHLEERRLKAEHRQDRIEWDRERADLEKELRDITRDFAQLSQLTPEQISGPPRRGRRKPAPPPADEETP